MSLRFSLAVYWPQHKKTFHKFSKLFKVSAIAAEVRYIIMLLNSFQVYYFTFRTLIKLQIKREISVQWVQKRKKKCFKYVQKSFNQSIFRAKYAKYGSRACFRSFPSVARRPRRYWSPHTKNFPCTCKFKVFKHLFFNRFLDCPKNFRF